MYNDPYLGLLDDESLEAALLPYEQYLKQFTYFKRTFLESPVMYDISRIQLPKLCTYHFVEMNGIVSGPNYADPLLKSIPGIKTIVHVKELFEPESTPIKVPGANIDMFLTEYRRRNQLIRPIVDTRSMEKDDRSLIIYNYSLLAMTWRYSQNFRAGYYRWSNIYKTVFHNLNTVAKSSLRNQYLDLELPNRIPTVAKCREFARTRSVDTLKYLSDPNDFLVADLFTWLSPDRDKSLLSMLSSDVLGRINFIVRKNSSWAVINLGWLDKLRESKAIEPKLLAAKVLMMFNRMLDISALVPDTVVNEEPETPVEKHVDEIGQGVDELISNLGSGGFIDDSKAEGGLVDDVTELRIIEKELEELDDMRLRAKMDTSDEDDAKRFDVDGLVKLEEGKTALVIKAEELLRKNAITPANFKRLEKISEKFETLEDPYGTGVGIMEAMEISEKDFIVEPKVVSTDEVILDKSMQNSRVDAFQEKYNGEIYRKDMLAMLSAVQKFPVAITEYKVVDKSDAMNGLEEHVIRLVPAVGEVSTVRVLAPKLEPDGTFLYSGVRYRMRNQRADLPLRKISPTEVVIASYASKCFVQRSERSRFNYSKFISSFLLAEATNADTTVFKNPNIATVVRYDVDLPWMYTTIANNISAFEIDDIKYNFDYNRREEVLGLTRDDLKMEKKGQVIVAKTKDGLILMHADGELVTIKNGLEDPFSDFETLLGIDINKVPLPMVELKIYSKAIPIGVALGYLIGLTKLLELLRAKVRRALPGERLNLESYEYVIRFKNELLILDSRDRRTTLVMAGWQHLANQTKQYDISWFDQQDVYAPLLERAGIQSRYLKELDAMNIGLIDPITEQLLLNMGEPTEYVPLLVRATEMLINEFVPTKREDSRELIELTERVRGYERVPGMAYGIMYKAMRSYAAKANRSDAKVIINPVELIQSVTGDPTCSPANMINPVHCLREREVVTFGGAGGRSKRAMVAKTRLYTNEDKGFISEATVDSGDVGVITYLAPNANITSIRGTVRLHNEKRDGNSMLLSTSCQLAPASDGDAPKRMGFISIQLGHQIATFDNDVSSYRTGGERSMIARMSKEYGQVAKGPGKVITSNGHQLEIEYDNGTRETFLIGTVEVNAEGTFYPHSLVTSLKVGDTFKKEDVLYYNAGFFKPSPLDKGKVDYMFGLSTFVAYREANYTIEDSCAISEHLSNRLRTNVTKVKSKVVDFSQEVGDVLKVGESVDLETVLMRIEDPFTQDMDKDELAQALRHFAALTPKAGVVGVVNRVEVFYNGEVEDMSPTLRELLAKSETVRKREAKSANRPYYPAKVTRYNRIDGSSIETNQALVVFHITLELGMGVSDKLVFGNQLKSTVGKVLFGNNRTLDGEAVDSIFGALSGLNRTVTGVYKAGVVNTYLRYVGEDIYYKWTN